MKSPLPRSITRHLSGSMSHDSADSNGHGNDVGAENKENGGAVSTSTSINAFESGKSCTKSTTSNNEKAQRALSSEITFLQQELSAIVEKHSMDKLASRKAERKYQEQIRSLAEELNEAKGRLEAKDGTIRVLEKQIRGKNAFIDELRGRIEGLVREKSELEEANAAAAVATTHNQSESEATVGSIAYEGSNNSTFCPTPSFTSSPLPPVTMMMAAKSSTPSQTPTRQTMKRSSGIGAGSVVGSARLSAHVSLDKAISNAVPKTPPPFRSPSPTSRMTPRSLQHHYLPQAGTNAPNATAQHDPDPSEGGIETQLTPSARSNFLLMEQKKTIESLTRALIAKAEELEKMEKEFEQYKIVVAQETKRAYFLSPKDLSLVTKGPTNAESVLCDSDEFEMETRDDAPSFTCSAKADKGDNVGGDESASDHFLNRLDNIGLDLSMDIADLSALIGEKTCATAAAALEVSTASTATAEGEI